eukprot:m.76332 g.76332  ORF g.76332 m.76332 type:complete len:567 (-) comp24885_c0_seq1:21-1721(-)
MMMASSGKNPMALRLAISRKFKQNSLFLRGAASVLIQKTLMQQTELDTEQLNRLLDHLLTAVSDQALESNFVEESHVTAAFEKIRNGGANTSETAVISSHVLQVINTFDVPRMLYNLDRKQFLETKHNSKLNPDTASSKAAVFRERFSILRQRTMRHPMFTKALEGSTKASGLELSPLSSLLGKRRRTNAQGSEQNTIIMGLISQLEEGKYFIEDSDGCVRIKFDNELMYTEGLFTEMSIIIAEGIYDDGIFNAKTFGFPPPEVRTESIKIFGSLNFFGGESLGTEKDGLRQIEIEEEGLMFAFFSDVWLDKPEVIHRLKKVFEGFSAMTPAPVFVFMGNFLSQSYGAQTAKTLKNCFDVLCDVILEFENLSTQAQFIFIPGPKDIGSGVCNILPRKPLPSFCTSRLAQKLPKAVFGTNPTRVRYCTQEIVLFREDVIGKMRRNCILAPKTDALDDKQISYHLVKTVVDQAHLLPLPLHIAPIYWEYDHALRLYPLPDLLVLADKFDTYRDVYSGTTAFNPGSFVTTDFSFIVYSPHKLRTFQTLHVGKEDETEMLLDLLQGSKVE